MKKLLYVVLSITILLSVNKTSAQWLQSGNNGFPGNFLGTLNNFPLNIRTNNTPRMTILATNGFVGINTPNPQSRLTVLGNATVGSNVAAPAPDGLRVFGRTYMGGNAPVAQGILHVDNSSAAFQLVLESTAPFNPDMTFADNTGVKGQQFNNANKACLFNLLF